MRKLVFPDDFLARIDRSQDCWLWKGEISYKGYGRWWTGARKVAAHRVSYGFFVGPLSDDLTIDHLCGVHACVRPEHLEAVPIRVNVLRGSGPAAMNARKTHCKRGHPLSGENLCPWANAGRQCRTCHELRTKGK